jgi:catalase (peroxidase I)
LAAKAIQEFTTGEKHGRKDRRKRGQVPIHGRHARTREPRLVAGPTQHRDAAQEFAPIRSQGHVEEFKSLDLNAVIKDLHALMTDRRSGGRPTSVTTAG